MNLSSTPSSEAVLQAAAGMEAAARDLYAELAGHVIFEPGLRTLFARLAAEEQQHASQIQALVRHPASPLWPGERTGRFLSELAEISAEIEDVRMAFRSNPGARRPGSVVRQLADMEIRFNRFHAVELAESLDPGVGRFFAGLALQDETHRELLHMARTRLGT